MSIERPVVRPLFLYYPSALVLVLVAGYDRTAQYTHLSSLSSLIIIITYSLLSPSFPVTELIIIIVSVAVRRFRFGERASGSGDGGFFVFATIFYLVLFHLIEHKYLKNNRQTQNRKMFSFTFVDVQAAAAVAAVSVATAISAAHIEWDRTWKQFGEMKCYRTRGGRAEEK